MLHCLSDLCDLTQSVKREVQTTVHHAEDLLELHEVLAFRRSQRIRIEERDDHFTKVGPSPYVVDEQIFFVIVMPAVSVDAAALEEVQQQLENFKTSFSLDNRKPWLHLPAAAHASIPLNRATKAAFSVDEADDPLLESWPFLLIARTDRIFTTHVITQSNGCDTNEYRRILGVPST